MKKSRKISIYVGPNPKIYIWRPDLGIFRFWTQNLGIKSKLKVDLTKIGPAEQLLLRAQGGLINEKMEKNFNLGRSKIQNLLRASGPWIFLVLDPKPWI